MVYRAQMGAANPADVFVPLMITTSISTLVGALFVCLKQHINLFDKVLISIFGAIDAIIVFVVWCVHTFPQEQVSQYSSMIANFLLISIIVTFMVAGVRKKINVYDAFIDGAKEGFQTAVMIIPYLVAMLVGIALFRTSGAMGFLTDGLASVVNACGLPTNWVDAFPTALMKPLSGSGSRGMMLDAMQTFGADSFTGRLATIVQGSTDTTFYVVAVYYGAIHIKNTRYTIGAALLADLAGFVTAIFVCNMFFG
jgi:spore maturation protein SpmB